MPARRRMKDRAGMLRMLVPSLLALLPLFSGCERAKTSSTQTIEAPPTASKKTATTLSTPMPVAPKEANRWTVTPSSLQKDLSGPLSITPRIPQKEANRVYYNPWPFLVAWKADSSEVASCAIFGDMDRPVCDISNSQGHRRSLSTQRDDPSRAETAHFQRKVRGLFHAKGVDWRYGSVISLAWRVNEERHVFELSARVKDESKGTVIYRLFSKQGPSVVYSISPEALVVAPDGGSIALALHQNAGEWTNVHSIHPWSSHEIAARAFNGAGMLHHREGRFVQAAKLFHRGAFTGSKSEKAMYNLACSLARTKDSGVREVLLEAIERGGDAVRVKARADEDLVSLRSLDWFRSAVGQD